MRIKPLGTALQFSLTVQNRLSTKYVSSLQYRGVPSAVEVRRVMQFMCLADGDQVLAWRSKAATESSALLVATIDGLRSVLRTLSRGSLMFREISQSIDELNSYQRILPREQVLKISQALVAIYYVKIWFS